MLDEITAQIQMSENHRQNIRLQRRRISADQFMAARIGDALWLKECLSNGDDPHSLDRNGMAAIHLAAANGRLNCLKMLIENYDVSVNQPTMDGKRPLHLVISKANGNHVIPCMQYLIQHGADIDCVDDKNSTPLHDAGREGLLEAVKLLICHGADVSVKDHNNHRAQDVARAWAHKQCTRVINEAFWKHEKTYMAKERAKLASLQKVYTSLRHEALHQLHQEQIFYGGIHHNNWRDEKGFSSSFNVAHLNLQKQEGQRVEGLKKRLQYTGKEVGRLSDCLGRVEELAGKFIPAGNSTQGRSPSKLQKKSPNSGGSDRSRHRHKKTQLLDKDEMMIKSRHYKSSSLPNSLVVPELQQNMWNRSTSLENPPHTNIYRTTNVSLGIEPDADTTSKSLPRCLDVYVSIGMDHGKPTLRCSLPGRDADTSGIVPNLPMDEIDRYLHGSPHNRLKQFKDDTILDVQHKRLTEKPPTDGVFLRLGTVSSISTECSNPASAVKVRFNDLDTLIQDDDRELKPMLDVT